MKITATANLEGSKTRSNIKQRMEDGMGEFQFNLSEGLRSKAIDYLESLNMCVKKVKCCH